MLAPHKKYIGYIFFAPQLKCIYTNFFAYLTNIFILVFVCTFVTLIFF